MHALCAICQQMINPRAPPLAFSYPTFLGGAGKQSVQSYSPTAKIGSQMFSSHAPPPLTSEMKIRKLGSAEQYLLSNPCPPAVGLLSMMDVVTNLWRGSFRSRRAGQNRGHVCRNPSGAGSQKISGRPRGQERGQKQRRREVTCTSYSTT